jgi:hypothetical protein
VTVVRTAFHQPEYSDRDKNHRPVAKYAAGIEEAHISEEEDDSDRQENNAGNKMLPG